MNPSSTTLSPPRWRLTLAICVAFSLLLAACGSSAEDTTASTVDESATASPTAESAASTDDAATDTDATESIDDHDEDADDDADADADTASASSGVDVSLFFDGALAEEVTTEDCTLSGGVETMCYLITVAGYPVTYETGPFCPSTITDTAEAGGLWLDGNNIYDIDGEFITDLAELYEDENWLMYDEDGNVLVTETAEEFEAAARPDVDPSLQNHCVEGRLEWLDNGEPVSSTVVIPVEPVLADSASTTRADLGVTLDGIVIAQSAPVDAILAAYTIAAFDDCGGHYNPVDGYHLHGAVGCSELGDATEGETPMFAYAIDGFPVHSALDDMSSADLDQCNGHETEELGYHYHANSAEQNLVLECLMGQIVATDDGAAGGRPDGPPPADE